MLVKPLFIRDNHAASAIQFTLRCVYMKQANLASLTEPDKCRLHRSLTPV